MLTFEPSVAIRAAADRLQRAAEISCPVEPIRDLIPAGDARSAYGVQEILTGRRIAAGGSVVGRKIGLTARSVQEQLGVDQPDFGILFADMAYPDGSEVPMSRLLQPKIEAEIAFLLAEDLDEEGIDAARARSAVKGAVAALEIVDSRIADWDITFVDTVADNGSSGLFVLGDVVVSMDSFEPAQAEMRMTVAGEVVSAGAGTSCLGDPLEALAWLARTVREFGSPLRAGEIVLSGALGPMVPIVPGLSIHASITGLGDVTARFSTVKKSEEQR